MSCSDESNYKEVILKRFTGGEKQVVAFYEGNGANEALVKRHTYDQYGELLLQEDLLTNTRKNWLQLHPELKASRGLNKYLQGEWIIKGVRNIGTPLEKNEIITILINRDEFTHHAVGQYKVVQNEWDKWDRKITANIEYKNDYFLNFLIATNKEKPKEIENKKAKVIIVSKALLSR